MTQARVASIRTSGTPSNGYSQRVSWIKFVSIGLALGGLVLGALVAFEGREFASTFRLIGVIGLVTCALLAAAMIRAGWDRVPLAGAIAFSGLIAWDALLGNRENDPMTSPLIGYVLFDLLAAGCVVAGPGIAVLKQIGRPRERQTYKN
jgi:hypothetical protein